MLRGCCCSQDMLCEGNDGAESEEKAPEHTYLDGGLRWSFWNIHQQNREGRGAERGRREDSLAWVDRHI